jgi:hypothetical protein
MIKVDANPVKYTPDILDAMMKEMRTKLIKLVKKGYEIF